MRNKVETCISETTDSQIKFEENKRKIIFQNLSRFPYECVDVDGCTIKEGVRCDKLLISADEREERYVELKGTDVMHAIEQLEETIKHLGEYTDNRHAYVISTNVAPAIDTKRQVKIKYFKEKYCAELKIQEKQLKVSLY
ncbi:MAG: hypothetical protein PUF62_09940 [Bacteroidales bacterium]|nr:hypothetical protein [Bacteroidales bacterium]